MRVLLAVEDARRAAVAATRLVAAILIDRALRRDVALQHDQAALGLIGSSTGRTTSLARRLDDAGCTPRRTCWPVTVSCRAVDVAALDQALGDQRDAAGLVEIGGGVAAARLEVADQRRAARDLVDVVDRRARCRPRAPARAGAAPRSSSRPIAATPATAFSKAVAGEDVARAQAGSSDHAWRRRPTSRAAAALAAGRIGGDRGRADGREADHLERHRHRVGRVLAAAGAGAGQAASSSSRSSSSLIRPAATAPMAS